jgi:hypothetical protein
MKIKSSVFAMKISGSKRKKSFVSGEEKIFCSFLSHHRVKRENWLMTRTNDEY